jgi:hypothetical protein
VRGTVVATPFVSSPMATINEEEVHVFQEPVVTHVEEKQQPPIQNVSHDEPLRRSQRARRSSISDDYELYVSEEIQIEGDSTSFEEAMRSAHSSNKFWGSEEISKGSKQWVANGSTRLRN